MHTPPSLSLSRARSLSLYYVHTHAQGLLERILDAYTPFDSHDERFAREGSPSSLVGRCLPVCERERECVCVYELAELVSFELKAGVGESAYALEILRLTDLTHRQE